MHITHLYVRESERAKKMQGKSGVICITIFAQSLDRHMYAGATTLAWQPIAILHGIIIMIVIMHMQNT